MTLIGAATTTGQTSQIFTLNFTDGTSGTGQLNMSSWTAPAGYSDETIVSTTAYRNTGSGGRTSGNTYLYGYIFPTDGTRVVKSLTLPNNRNIVIVGLSLTTSPNPTMIPGTYTYTPPAGSVPNVGTVPLNVAFTPTNPSYGTATASVNLVVNKAPLTVTGNSQTVSYGTALAPYSYTMTGFVNGDTQAGATTGAPSLSTVPANPINAGTYTLTTAAGTLASSNYTPTFVNGLITINQATLTVSANNATRVYNTANPTFTGSITGAVNGDTFTESFATSAITTFSGGSVCDHSYRSRHPSFQLHRGDQPWHSHHHAGDSGNHLEQSGCDHVWHCTFRHPAERDRFGRDSRHRLVYTPALGAVLPAGTQTLSVTFTPTDTTDYTTVTKTVSIQVNKSTLTVTAASQSVVYGTALAPYTYTMTGFVGSDTQATATTGAPSLTTSPATPTAAGTYPITAAIGSLASSNYSFTFVNGSAVITKANLTVTANSQSVVYGTALAPYTYTMTGFVSGDTQATATTGSPSLTTSPATPKNVGTYTITAAIGSLAASNYTFTFVNGSAVITKATLTVTANSQSVVYGTALAPYTYTMTGFVSGDTQATATTGAPSLTTVPATPTAVGTYPITAAIGSLAASNYMFTFVNGSAVITKATLTVTANSQSVVYGTALAPYTYTMTGFVSGDTQATATTGAPSLTTSPASPTAAGTYPIIATVG